MNEENENASPWDSLVGELGVEVSPEALERKQPAPKQLPAVSHERSDVAPPASAPSDWAGLASSLGLEVPPEETPRKPTAATRQQTEPVRTGEARGEVRPREARQREDKPRGERKRDDRKSGRGRDRKREKSVEVRADIEIEEAMEDLDDDLISEDSVTELDVAEEAPSEPEKPRMTGEAARSAFDALFSAEAVNWGSAFVSPRTNVESSFLFTEGEEAVFEEDIPDKTELDEDNEEDEPNKRPRRRRRGGRGRGRSRKDEQAEDADSDEGSVVESDEAEQSLSEDIVAGEEAPRDVETKPEKRRRRRRGRGRGQRGEEGEAETEEADDSHVRRRIAAHVADDDDAEDEGDSSEEARGGHRNLPTWNDAIGVIVDGNLAQRSKTPAKQQSQPRGRGRGGRRHKKS